MRIELSAICKNYPMAGVATPILRGVSLVVESGDFIGILGRSGSGKSTLLNIIGCLDSWDSGEYRLDGQSLNRLDEKALARVRRRHLGFVFQSFNLIPRFDALRNVELPLIYAGVPPRERRRRALSALARVELAERADHTPDRLSGGEQQRVAIARALINDPDILILDEATGNLDSVTGHHIMELIAALHAQGKTIVAVTHDPGVADYAGKVWVLKDGVLQAGDG
ncbi:MAG: ABC transporter ATP-binding protein [Methylococcaceae bacterium]|nr:ABC transporter ATP-binding protein [Methylococcaceae bacterium]